MAQVTSKNNFERRDAILPNNQFQGFWRHIWDEFQCHHVVREFKNGVHEQSKEAINQLRIYLSKPTIGRFGLLFVRHSPAKSLLQAQKDAYEQERILILIIDDLLLCRLLQARAFLGSAEDVLENEKIKFEIDY
jgi:hypothetical protein